MSRTLTSVGPNASLVAGDMGAALRGLKAGLTGRIEVASPDLAGSLTALGLIDEYQIYVHPVVMVSSRPTALSITSTLKSWPDD